MRHVFFIFIAVSVLYTQDCNANNWQQYSPNLEYCDLEDANIAWMDVSEFNFFGANLTSANLTGSNFSGSNLINAILIDADLTWTTFIGSNLTDANLSGAGLGAADFTDANLSGAILYGAIFFDTNFSNACIEGTYGFPASGYIGEPIEEGCSALNTNPGWSLDPLEFEHVMSITARVFDGSEDTGWESDIVGAFSGGECVGVAEAAEVPPFLGGGYAFLIQAYSHNSFGDIIEFQFYSEADNMIYNISETLSFVSYEIIGDLNNTFDLYIVGSNNNNTPIAESATYTLDEDNIITIYLPASDADGDALSFTINDFPIHGTLTLSGVMATYIPNVNYHGMDTFTFIANDGQSNSNIGTINLAVNAVNDAPYLNNIADAQIQYGEAFLYTLTANDVDGDALIYTATISEGNATANINGNILTITPQEPNVTLQIVVTVSDGNATHSASFLLTVLPQLITCFDNNSDGWCDQYPTITLNEGSVLLFETESGAEYVDPGAQCYDNEDGNISDAVEISGQIVNMAIPDMYQIHYDCLDADGNAAQRMIRTVAIIPNIISDENEDGFDDAGFIAGAQSGDVNLDGALNIVDIVIFIDNILNGE
tara:strand:- start:6882 stop:8675 length:1794 start_codon:yes stop_codon:yes gene_type:complete